MTSTPRNSAGRVIGGRYMLLSLIAKGGMGEVWKARDQLSGRLVAAKVLRPELSGEELPLSRLRLEAQNALRIEHPNIAAVLDSGEDNGRGWLVMELIEGRPLTDYLRGGQRLSAEYLIPVLIQMAMALSAAAAAGVVHRDIKPANVLVRPSGMVKITDFGISRTADQIDLTAAGMVMGTAQYLPPEQALGEVATTLGDLYALGVIAYEAAAGKRPFTGSSQVEIAFAHVNEAVPPLPDDVPPLLAQIILHLLEKEPSKRPATGRALIRELVDAAQALKIPIAPRPLPQPKGAPEEPAPSEPHGVVPPIRHTPARTLPEEMLRPVDLDAASLDAVVGPEQEASSDPHALTGESTQGHSSSAPQSTAPLSSPAPQRTSPSFPSTEQEERRHPPVFRPVRGDTTASPQQVSRRSLKASVRRQTPAWHSISPTSVEAAATPVRQPTRTRYSRSVTAPPIPRWRKILRWLIAGVIFLALVTIALAVLFSQLGLTSPLFGAGLHPLQEVTTWSTPWPTT